VIKNLENQINWFDQLGIPLGSDPVSQSMKTSRAQCQAQVGTIGKPSSKKPSGSSSQKPPICLCLTKDGPSMEWCSIPPESGALPGLSTIVRWKEFRSGEPGWLWSPTTGEYTQQKSSLSAILEENLGSDSRYNLSAKACRGILSRAERRGKELPEELKQALLRQAGAE